MANQSIKERITELEEQIALLPKGSVGQKTVKCRGISEGCRLSRHPLSYSSGAALINLFFLVLFGERQYLGIDSLFFLYIGVRLYTSGSHIHLIFQSSLRNADNFGHERNMPCRSSDMSIAAAHAPKTPPCPAPGSSADSPAETPGEGTLMYSGFPFPSRLHKDNPGIHRSMYIPSPDASDTE